MANSPAAEIGAYREQVERVILELQANRVTLDELLNWYTVFVFTGGDVPRGGRSLDALPSYLDRPFAAGLVSTEDIRRYCLLVKSMMERGQATGVSGPKSLRYRHEMGRVFDVAASEIRCLGIALESRFKGMLSASASRVGQRFAPATAATSKTD